MSGHRVEWRIHYDSIYGALICEEPEGSPCRMSCPEGCETVCDHDLVAVGYCNAVEWMDNSGQLEDFHEGDTEEVVRDGPVTIRWDGFDENWLWKYQEPHRPVVPAAAASVCPVCSDEINGQDPVVTFEVDGEARDVCESCAPEAEERW